MIPWGVASAWAGTWETVVAVRADETFVGPTEVQRAETSAFLADLGVAAPGGVVPPSLVGRADALGFRLTVVDDVAVLTDRPDALRGAGLVAVRLGTLPGEVVLQAPHPFFDLGTGEIASLMFDAGGPRALVVATANRDAAPGSDPSHTPESWFQAATDGLAASLSQPLFVQLHGFAERTSDACAVLSEGSARMDPARLARLVLDLGPVLGCADVRTGEQVPALAARTNAQARLLVDRADFLHLELSSSTRSQLLAASDARARLSSFFARAATEP